MIVTRTWLEEFIDLEGITNDALYATFNAIGLEVDSLKEHTIPAGVIVGRIVACGRHPDADKLSLCQIDIGTGEPQQIICGAANVKEAEYVAVATLGAVLPGDFTIKPAKLRGVESFGMVCSAEELGLPKIGEGIMILDESIGELEVGRELRTYPLLNDTVIELELTANRGDCLSIHGVARDLSAALDRPIKAIEPRKIDKAQGGIARKISIQSEKDLPAQLAYLLAENEALRSPLLLSLRLAFVGIEVRSGIEKVVRYSTHATGVILRAYDAQSICNGSDKITLKIGRTRAGTVAVAHDDRILSQVGIRQEADFVAQDESSRILLEASYIDPDSLVEAVALHKLETDALYYNTSRGSEPDLELGALYLKNTCALAGSCRFYEGELTVHTPRRERTVSVSVERLSAIVGNPLSKTTIHTILKRLGFGIRSSGQETFGVQIPPHRHDIHNIQDIAEEILRIMGIDNIEAKPLQLIEKDRTNEAVRTYRQRRDLRQRAAAAGFYEAVTYAFTDRARLEKYGLPVIDEALELANPIVEELNTLRTTLIVNLLDAARRNVNYGIKRIALFEAGAVFDARREQTERVAFVWSGQREPDSMANQGKPPAIDLAAFADSVGRAIGDFALRTMEEEHGLVHPYRSAVALRDGQAIGYLAQLHPDVADDYGLPVTYIAEFDWEAIRPKHTLVTPVSNYQGTVKDLSVLVDADVTYDAMRRAIGAGTIPLLKRVYPVDLYRDASLGEQRSVTLRLFLQSDEGTLSDGQIDTAVQTVLSRLEEAVGARLR